ncbi:hypothetical protein CSKR_201893 [Clonorchis sinensis]|uniref:Uncharacterized protein n=1 Tax=Clonorchis sinensis TaxID=79923 RepID=A0A8T1MXY2_CLOSI|nr:hypothetical protein CSKR_201893 [Clonorchis sinensis]
MWRQTLGMWIVILNIIRPHTNVNKPRLLNGSTCLGKLLKQVRQTDLSEEWQEVLLELILDTALLRCPVGRKKSRLASKLRTMYCGDWKIHVSRDVPEINIQTLENFMYAVVGDEHFIVCKPACEHS